MSTFTPYTSSIDDQKFQGELESCNEEIKNAIENSANGKKHLTKARSKVRKIKRHDPKLAELIQAKIEELLENLQDAKEGGELSKLIEKVNEKLNEIEDELNLPEPPRKFGNPRSAEHYFRKIEKIDSTLIPNFQTRIKDLETRIQVAESNKEVDKFEGKVLNYIEQIQKSIDSGFFSFKITNTDISSIEELIHKIEQQNKAKAKALQTKLDSTINQFNTLKSENSQNTLQSDIETELEHLTEGAKSDQHLKVEQLNLQKFNSLINDLNSIDTTLAKNYMAKIDLLKVELKERSNKVEKYFSETLPLKGYLETLQKTVITIHNLALTSKLPFEQRFFDNEITKLQKFADKGLTSEMQNAIEKADEVFKDKDVLLKSNSPFSKLSSIITSLKFYYLTIENKKEAFYDLRDKLIVDLNSQLIGKHPIVAYNHLKCENLFWLTIQKVFKNNIHATKIVKEINTLFANFESREKINKQVYKNYFDDLEKSQKTHISYLAKKEHQLEEIVENAFNKASNKDYGEIICSMPTVSDWKEVKCALTNTILFKTAPFEIATKNLKNGKYSLHIVTLIKKYDGEQYGSIEVAAVDLNFQPITKKEVEYGIN